MEGAIRPAALRQGDRVMLVSPSGPTRAERVARGVELLTGWGLDVVTAPHVFARARLPGRGRRADGWPT